MTPSALLIVVRQFRRLYEKYVSMATSSIGISSVEASIIMLLHNYPEYSTARELSDYLRIMKSQTSKAIASLAAKKLVDVAPDKDDKRIQHLVLTPAADSIVTALENARMLFMEKVCDGIEAEDQKAFLETLDKIAENVEANLLEND